MYVTGPDVVKTVTMESVTHDELVRATPSACCTVSVVC